jgi:hypothetical protein
MTISFGATEFGWWRNDREAINKDQSRHLDWAKIPRICMAYNTITALIAGTGSSAGSALCDLPVRAAPQWRTRSDYRGKASTSVAGLAGGCLDGAAELLGGAAGGALSTAAVSAELLSAGDTPVAAGLFAGAAGGLLATGDVGTDLLAAGAGPVGAGLFVVVAVGLSATGDAELSVAAGSPVAAGVFAVIAAGGVVLGGG